MMRHCATPGHDVVAIPGRWGTFAWAKLDPLFFKPASRLDFPRTCESLFRWNLLECFWKSHLGNVLKNWNNDYFESGGFERGDSSWFWEFRVFETQGKIKTWIARRWLGCLPPKSWYFWLVTSQVEWPK